MKPRIGLFGGSFNPPHLAHLALARVARDTLGLQQLLWLPAGSPWQKAGQQLAPGADRAAMVAALIEDEPGMRLDTRELQRPGPSYTVDTARELRAEHPETELVLVIGQDQYARLHTWHQVQDLLALTTLAVAARDGQAPQAPSALQSTPHRCLVLPLPRMDIASTPIRQRVAAGPPVSPLVGPAVARYIEQQNLYRASPGT